MRFLINLGKLLFQFLYNYYSFRAKIVKAGGIQILGLVLITFAILVNTNDSLASQCQSLFLQEKEILLSPSLKAKLRQHHESSEIQIGGMILKNAFQGQNVINENDEFYTPENAKMVSKMAEKLKELIRKPTRIRIDIDQLNVIRKDSSYPIDKLFEFIWSSVDIQEMIYEALERYKEAVESNYAQGKVIEFLDLYTTVLSIPYYLAMKEERINQQRVLEIDGGLRGSSGKDRARDRFLFDRIVYGLNSLEFRDQIELLGPVKFVLSLNSYKGDRIANQILGRKNLKYKLILIDSIVGEYEIARFFHLGVIPVGVFTTASVGYDNEINSNLGATVHDLETHWKFYLNISLTRGTPLSSVAHKVRNEVAAFVIDKLLEGSSKIQREEIEVARVYQSIHEEGRGTMAKVLRGIILDLGEDWFKRSVSGIFTPTEISEIYQIIGYQEQEEGI